MTAFQVFNPKKIAKKPSNTRDTHFGVLVFFCMIGSAGGCGVCSPSSASSYLFLSRHIHACIHLIPQPRCHSPDTTATVVCARQRSHNAIHQTPQPRLYAPDNAATCAIHQTPQPRFHPSDTIGGGKLNWGFCPRDPPQEERSATPPLEKPSCW